MEGKTWQWLLDLFFGNVLPIEEICSRRPWVAEQGSEQASRQGGGLAGRQARQAAREARESKGERVVFVSQRSPKQFSRIPSSTLCISMLATATNGNQRPDEGGWEYCMRYVCNSGKLACWGGSEAEPEAGFRSEDELSQVTCLVRWSWCRGTEQERQPTEAAQPCNGAWSESSLAQHDKGMLVMRRDARQQQKKKKRKKK